MSDTSNPADRPALPPDRPDPPKSVDSVCPICGAAVVQEKCKVVCRSSRCGYRIVMTCSEF